jgi:hypothetical protein
VGYSSHAAIDAALVLTADGRAVSARWLLEEGLEVVLFEGAGQLGGVWRYDNDAEASTNCTYKVSATVLIGDELHQV